MTETPASSTTPTSSNGKMDAAIGIGADILDRVQDVLKGGRIKSVRIKLGNRTVREIPVEAAAFTAIVLAIAAVVVSQLHVELVKA